MGVRKVDIYVSIISYYGKSASGKDTIFQKLKQDSSFRFKTVIPYTTRPKREGEVDGEQYYFVSQEKFIEMQKEHRIIESRVYHTIHGDWTYFTADDGQIIMDSEEKYLLIGTLEVYESIKAYYRKKLIATPSVVRIEDWLKQCIVPIYVEVEDGIRLERAIQREQLQQQPAYSELCHRFLADEESFSLENLNRAGIVRKFVNQDLEICVEEIRNFIMLPSL